MPRSSIPNPLCLHYSAAYVVRIRTNQSGTPKSLCRSCRRQFVAHPKAGPVPAEKEVLVRRLLNGRLSLRTIARSARLSRGRPQTFANRPFGDESRWRDEPPPQPAAEKKRAVVIEADEMWSFVRSKENAHWN
jgi:insertion element IS1 protein InsB